MNNEKPGIIMILASLLVMGFTAYFLFDFQVNSREQQAREQGLGLARLMSSMGWEQVINQPGKKGLLEAFRQGQNNPDFAYGVIVDVNGSVKSEVTSPGIIVPNAPLPMEPSAWLGQRTVTGMNNQHQFIESHAPLFLQGEHRGFVRLGYIQPELKFGFEQMPYIATLTLPIFLLTPLFYFFLRQEIKPLKKISESIEHFTESSMSNSMELQPSAELGNFMDRFNQFMDMTQARINELSHEQDDLVISSKLLAYKNNKVESILKTLPEAIMVIDEGGIVSYANDKTVALLGIDSDEVVNKKPQHWCKNPEVINLLSGTHSQGTMLVTSAGSIADQEFDQNKKLEIRTYPLFSPMDDSKLLGRLVVIRDVTAQMFEQQRQGEFITQVSHEMKTPLNVLQMYSEILLDKDLTSEEEQIEAANVIHDEVERLSNLIKNLLSISQYELGGLVVERQRVRMHDFLSDIFDNISKSDTGKNLRFKLDLPNEMSSLMIDKALMRIAINNLLTNAIKYNKPEGLVTLQATESTHFVDIRVIDEGYGISEEDQKHIFDKFFRSDDDKVREQTGHGLGLSLTQQIVHIHHGEIMVTSSPGQGSLFQVRLEKDIENS